MATEIGEDFVTIVPVGEGKPSANDSSFVTVLTVGAATGAAEVVVRRPRGERLGLGLKFEGGSAAAEKVRRLLVQSCAEDSPAANACAPWGNLIPGDEILAIDGVSVSNLTRIDCVRRLKDSDESLTLLVRHFESGKKTESFDKDKMSESLTPVITRPTTLPPPVPPRKLGKKNSFKDKPTLQTVGEQNLSEGTGDATQQNDRDYIANGKHNDLSTLTKLSRKSSFDSHILRQSKEGIAYLKKGSPEEVRRLVRRLSDGKAMPPEAEIYIDLFSSEWERCLVLADAESDDTGSSISTVVDRLGSMASSVENSIPSTPTMQPKTIDIQQVLNCIENIDTDILRDITHKKSLLKQTDLHNDFKSIDKSFSIKNSMNVPLTNSHTLDENNQQLKILLQNDKNNNNTILQNNTTNTLNETYKSKSDVPLEKPKPMPRSTKVERSTSERKPRPLPVPETPPPPIPEPLLTPTKKNCIETWLQRSEAEMNNNKTIEKMEDNASPEALPRLIDFVPKSQFKETVEPPSLTRPTAPPPPPPAETREDGSGASLDTIGELDESTDVTDNAKPTTKTAISKDRKPSFERNFWEDRINRSDNEDKSLSNDETPLPSCPRQPPDGVETPNDVVEKIPDPPSRLPPLHFIRPRYSYSRIQDARSEASVKDKIAMFSNEQTVSTDRIDKCGTLPTKNGLSSKKNTSNYSNYSDISSLDRRLTKSQDNLDELPRYCKKIPQERSDIPGGIGNQTVSNYSASKNSRLYSENKPLFYGSTTTLPSTDSALSQPVYHMRSTSDDSTNKKSTSSHKSNLEYLIEQRKKSMSKLRGLVIPEVQGPVVGLPEIKIRDSIPKTLLYKDNETNSNKNTKSKQSVKKPILLNETKWNTLLPNNLPKYSPAFKRKSLQVYTPTSLSKESTPERNFTDKIDTLNKINTKLGSKPLRGTIEVTDTSSHLPPSLMPTKSYLINSYSSKKEIKDNLSYIRDYKNFDIKICTTTDIVDSDNDSAMSSTQSSYRSSASSPMHNLETVESDNSRLSPRISNYNYSLIKSDNVKSPTEKAYDDYLKKSICRSMSSDTNVSLSSSAGSAATSGSQASCSSLESSVADSDKRKVSKSYNIDTINRRNILASAKCRSGRDLKLNSPVIETKFSHESCDSSPSPAQKASERLSTLTPAVSAVSNKGENRRRNKIIAESDSDSDSDTIVRQRKTDYKNSRLKRNSSSTTKSKSNENNSESPKSEDAPRVISEKIIKEIKKAGLDNFSSTKHTVLLDKKSFDIIKNDSVVIKNNDKTIKPLQSQKGGKECNSVDSPNKDKSSSKVSDKINISGRTIENDKIASDAKISTRIVRLRRGVGSGVGVILAGGIDCEAKDVTVHRVLSDSVAAKAGILRGVKIRSINGFPMSGLTHAQSVTVLKEQRDEVVIEIENDTTNNANGAGCGSEKAESKSGNGVEATDSKASGTVVSVVLEKAGGGAGLGFGLDGGRDSPRGDCPLTIKKLFAGGSAAQSGLVLVGAELLSAGGQSMEGFTRTQAWAALKALPAGPVTLVLRNPKTH